MADNYSGKCGSCEYIYWKECVWGKFGCNRRPGTYVLALERADDCMYYERSRLSNEEIEKLRLSNLR